MKKLFFFLAASAAMFTSCSSDDDATTPPVVEEGVTAIDVTSSASTTVLGGSFTFTVKDQDGNVLPAATLTVNQTAISNPWTPTAVGTYTVSAAFENLTDAVTVTVTEVPQTENTFAINNGPELLTDQSLFAYLGTDENNVNHWAALAALLDVNGEETINQTIVYFTNNQVDEQYLDFPTSGNYTFGETVPGTTEAEVSYTSGEGIIELTTTDLIQSLDLNIISIAIPEAEGDPQNWNYTYNLALTDGTVVKGNFNGDWQFINAAGRPGRNTKQIVKLNSSQIKQNKANFLKK